jgi:hypothetical protein
MGIGMSIGMFVFDCEPSINNQTTVKPITVLPASPINTLNRCPKGKPKLSKIYGSVATIIAKQNDIRSNWPFIKNNKPREPKVTIDKPPNKPSIPSTILKALIAPTTVITVTK